MIGQSELIPRTIPFPALPTVRSGQTNFPQHEERGCPATPAPHPRDYYGCRYTHGHLPPPPPPPAPRKKTKHENFSDEDAADACQFLPFLEDEFPSGRSPLGMRQPAAAAAPRKKTKHENFSDDDAADACEVLPFLEDEFPSGRSPLGMRQPEYAATLLSSVLDLASSLDVAPGVVSADTEQIQAERMHAPTNTEAPAPLSGIGAALSRAFGKSTDLEASPPFSKCASTLSRAHAFDEGSEEDNEDYGNYFFDSDGEPEEEEGRYMYWAQADDYESKEEGGGRYWAREETVELEMASKYNGKTEGNLSRSPSSVMLFDGY
eukprot:CAMPEP_0194298502 /NCGR_PEP_ID=MMETSP0169-20130528/60203_1 /TAXON_ID=218684 /ORGANISM="Corethron pennatum, Strain L29A3" /LENGTH=319 /DNA_ID=CAMNT_0039048497 /DNA_START=141 /DNA_END=1101 /DNA_ORIENTATION=-